MVDLRTAKGVWQCRCWECRERHNASVLADHEAINRVVAMLDERQRRLFAGLLAMRRGHGGILLVAQITGLSRTTIRRGMAELRCGVDPNQERIRQPGGGRKLLEKKSLAW